MPVEWTRDDARRLFTAVATGPLILAEVLVMTQTYRIGEYRPYKLLFDASAATTDARTPEVRSLVAGIGAAARESARGPVAVVATDSVLYGMARMYQTLAEEVGVSNIRVFRTVADAEEWLDVKGGAPG